MIILTIRTDKPEAEIGIFADAKQLSYHTWTVHRQLAESLHRVITEQLQIQKLDLHNIQGIVCYEGPGSFTGLRIGLSVANALAYSLAVPIVGATGENWQSGGMQRLVAGENTGQIVPMYGAPVHITTPKH